MKEVEKRRRRKKGWKEFVRKKRKKGRMRFGKRRKKGRENEREGERDERRGRERRTENRESGIRNVPPPPNTFPSTKLGNNMTPIKGRLGKNTTPTSRDPTELNQNPQANPPQRRSSLERHNLQSMVSMTLEQPFIRRLKHTETREVVSNSP